MNAQKTNILVFERRMTRNEENLLVNVEVLVLVNRFVYLDMLYAAMEYLPLIEKRKCVLKL